VLQHTGRARTHEYGVSEVIGAVMLIAVVGAAVAIIAVALLSQPAPEKIPALEAVISNTGNAIQIYHNGGDTLQKADFKVLVNGAEVPESVLWPGSDTTWSSGETLTFVSPNAKTVQIVYAKGSSAAAVLSSADFGAVAGNSTLSLTITSAAGSGGSISPSGVVPVTYGGSQMYTITPNDGYRVATVLVDGNSIGVVSTYTFSTVTSSHSIYVTFAKNPVITASAGDHGSISPSGSVSVDYSGSQSFSIVPDTGYHVADVLVDTESQGAITSYNFTNVMEDHTISATFAISSYSISATAGSNGVINPAGDTAVIFGGSQEFTITPDAHYHVADVLVDTISQGSITNYTFTNVAANHTIAATFAINTYTITASSGENGTVTPAGVTTVNYGSTPIFNVTPNTGYHIVDVLVNGTSVGSITSYVFPAVVDNQTISATFAINTYTITPSIVGGNGTVSPATEQVVNYGDTPTFTFMPATGYHLNTVTVNGTVVTPTGNSYTFPAVDTNKTIIGTFAVNTYTITPSIVGGNGTVSPATEQVVNYGDTPTFTFAPAMGYHLNTVTVNGTLVTPTGNSYTFPAVDTNKTIIGTFAINTYTINVIAGSNGAISPGNTTVNYGGSQAFTITPNVGYYVADVLVDNVSNGTITNYTFTNVVANHSISASFLVDPPVANFTATPLTGGVPLNVQFTDTSTNNPTAWVWNFGDTMNTTVSYAQHPNHTYEYPGNYSVRLWATNDGGTTDTTKDGYIFTYYAAVANFTGEPTAGTYGPFGVTVYFTDRTPVEIGISSWNWTFGDGKAKTEYNYHQNPGHTYDAVGLYSVNLSVYNAFSSDYLLRPDYINVTPSAPDGLMINGGPTEGVVPLTVDFWDLTTNYSTVPVSYNWYFADGTPNETTMDVTHTFTSPGTYEVTHTAYNIWGSGTTSMLVTAYAAPAVTGVSPSSGTTAGSTPVTIVGTNLVGASGATFGGTAATGVSVINTTAVSAITPAHAAGAVNVLVTTPNGTATGTNVYTYISPPTVTSVTPASGTSSGGTTVTIVGTNLVGASGATFGGTAATGVSVINTTAVSAITPAHAAGAVNVLVTTPNGTATGTNVYTYVYPAPSVTSVTPSTGTMAGSTTVTIIGTNFVGASGATFGGTAATGVSVINTTAVSAITPAHAAGAVNVLVTTPNGTATGTNAYTYLIPITATSGANGAVTPAGVTLYSSGSTPTYTITPDSGYHVADVLVDGGSVGAVTSYTFPSLTTSHTISATFVINTYTVTASSGSGGTISPSGVTTYNYGATPTYTITRNPTYSIGDVLVDGSSVGAVTSYTFPALAANHTISASFTKNPSVQIYYQPFNTNTGWPYDSWTRSSNTYVTLSTTIRNGTSGYSVRDRRNYYFGRVIPTTGYDEIYVRYAWATTGLSSSEYAQAQYSLDGSNYPSFAQITGAQYSLSIVNTSLPTAGDNANFELRWRLYGSSTSDYLYVDDVQVFGTAI